MTYEELYTTVYVVVLPRFEIFHSSPSHRFPLRNSQIALPFLEVAGKRHGGRSEEASGSREQARTEAFGSRPLHGAHAGELASSWM